jgi:hypothetical protein
MFKEEDTLFNGEIVILDVSEVSGLVSHIEVYTPDGEKRIHSHSFSPYVTREVAIYYAENRRVF